MQKDFVEFLKDRASALDIISKHVKLTRKGRDWFGKCPFHSEKTGSFKVSPESGLYYCFGCGAHGDVIKFVMETERMTFSEAVKYIADMYGIKVPDEREQQRTPENDIKNKLYYAMDVIKDHFARQILSAGGNEALEYLKERNISAESIEKFKLGFAINDDILIARLKKSNIAEDLVIKSGVFFKNSYTNELNNKFAGRIMFPIIDYKDRCVGFGGRIIKKSDVAKYINSPETDIFVKSRQLYGYHLAKHSKSRQLVLVEGYLDVISMHQAGFDATVAPLGTSISETQINMCWKICDSPIIALDGDSAGQKASFRWVDKILPVLQPGKSFRFARLPQNSDPDSLILNGQSSLIDDALENALSLSDWMWEGAFLLYPAETPEQKAAIVKMLFEKTELIKDISIKKLYIQYIKQKESDLYRYKKRNNTAFASKNFKRDDHIKAVTPVKEKIEKILVVTIIKYPYIIDKIIEEFTKLDFSIPLMIKLKSEILNIYNIYYISGEYDKGNEAFQELRQSIADMEADVIIHARFLEQNDISEEDIISNWMKFFTKYLSVPEIAKDLHEAAVSLQSSFSENDWKRLKALKNSTLLAAKNRRK